MNRTSDAGPEGGNERRRPTQHVGRSPASISEAFRTRRSLPRLLPIFIVLVGGCWKDADRRPSREHDPVYDPAGRETPLVALLANPEAYDGKEVSVSGYHVLAFEESALYPSREMSISPANGIWLNYLGSRVARKGSWVRIKGIFDAYGHGHLGVYRGSFREVTELHSIEGLLEWPASPGAQTERPTGAEADSGRGKAVQRGEGIDPRGASVP